MIHVNTKLIFGIPRLLALHDIVMLGKHQCLLLGGVLERALGGDLTETQKYQIKSAIFHLVSGWTTSRASTKN